MSDARPNLVKQPLNSLATKLILFVFVSTFVTALAVSWISIQSTHTYLSRLIGRQFPESLAHAGEELLGWLVDGEEAIGALADEAELRRAAPRAGDADARLVRALRHSKHFEALALVDGRGRVRHSAGDVAELAAGQTLGIPSVERTVLRSLRAGATTLLFAATPFPVEPDGGGALIGMFARSRIPPLLARGRPVSGGEIALLAGDGRVIARSDAATGTGSLPLDHLLAEGKDRVHEYATDTGVHVVGAVHPLGLFDWHVAVEVPFEVAYEPVLAVVTRVFVVDLCIILLLSYLAYRITTAVVRPIEALSDAARRIAQGQFDLEIPEPSAHDEIGLLTRTFNDMMRKLRGYQVEIETANRSLTERNGELSRANEVLSQLSITDGLTKLHNHRFFQDHLTREIKRVNRVNEPLSMLLIDLDDFKSLNDRLGHAAGDELLLRVARGMNEAVRETDLLARYGGEEFVVLTSGTELLGAYRLAEKLRTTIAEQSFILGESLRPTRVTVSIGVAQYQGNRKKFFDAADQALYRAKASGKNCVVVDDEEALRRAQESDEAQA